MGTSSMKHYTPVFCNHHVYVPCDCITCSIAQPDESHILFMNYASINFCVLAMDVALDRRSVQQVV